MERMLRGVLLAVVFAGTACAGSGASPPSPAAPAVATPPQSPAPPVAQAEEKAEPPAPKNPLTEAEARVLLANRFRAAGLRILRDQQVEVGGVGVTLDGYDVEARIGYEYVAIDEAGSVPLPTADGSQKADGSQGNGPRLLLLRAMDREQIIRAADEFLAGVKSSSP